MDSVFSIQTSQTNFYILYQAPSNSHSEAHHLLLDPLLPPPTPRIVGVVRKSSLPLVKDVWFEC